MESNSTAFLIKIKLRHSLGRPSRSDFVQSDITVSQDLIIGYVKDGIMYEGEVFDELSGKYSFSPDEKGEYFFYLLSGSSDYLSLKSGNLEVN